MGAISVAISGPVEVAWSLGSLSNDDGDFNENGIKQQQPCAYITFFLYISLPSLHDYDVKLPNFTWTQDTDFFFLSWTQTQPFRIQLLKKT